MSTNLYKNLPPLDGQFGAVRKYDIHTGVDLHCPVETLVPAIEDGIVVAIEHFTGVNAGSPWWHDTQAVLVEGVSGVILYGEVRPLVDLDQRVRKDEIVGSVLRVLKNDKGKPLSMLHLELYKPGTRASVWWKHNEPQPENLLDVMELLKCLNT